MLTVAIHSSDPPYLAVTAGPKSHSPPPIAEAPITRPGPSIASTFRQVKNGASISSPASHLGICCEPGCGTSKAAAVSLITLVLPGRGERGALVWTAAARRSTNRVQGSGFRVQRAECETRNPEPGTRNPEPETRNYS